MSWRRAPRESKITHYVLVYNTSYADHHGELTCRGSRNDISLRLVPYTTYTFQVRARNAFGLSDPSPPTGECSTPPARPYKNPRNVCVKNIHPHQLVITWKVRGSYVCLSSAPLWIQIGPRWKRYWEDSTITENGEGKCCGRALKAAGGIEIVSVVRIRAPTKWLAGARIQVQSTGGKCMDSALINTWGHVKGQIEGKWVGVA